jgi:hypothetical protein
MDFYEVLEQVIALLQRHGRVTYRMLKRQVELMITHEPAQMFVTDLPREENAALEVARLQCAPM